VSSLNHPGLSGNAADVLSDTTAGGISYFTIIPAAVFLLSEPYKGSWFVRFNAWQSIFLFAVWLVVDFFVSILQILAPGAVFLTLSPVQLAVLVFLAFWLVALVSAFNGKRYKLPMIGKWAEKQARG
jgi:uncharacterized membrane protein